MMLLRRDPKTGTYLCPNCGGPMIAQTVEGRHPREQYTCEQQTCGHIEPVYDRSDEGEA